MELSELSSQQEASLFRSGLEEWQEGSASFDLRSDIDLPKRKGEAECKL